MNPPGINLRRIGPEDSEVLFEWRNDSRVYAWCRQNDVLHIDQHNDWIRRQQSDPRISMYLIEDCEVTVGVCGLTDIDLINRRAEFSLYIGPEYQGNGCGETALRELLKKAFLTMGLNSVWGEAFDGNPAIAMFRKVGFLIEGTRRQFYYRNGKFIDANLFSISRDAWNTLNSST